jgi:hypothetical protein
MLIAVSFLRIDCVDECIKPRDKRASESVTANSGGYARSDRRVKKRKNAHFSRAST